MCLLKLIILNMENHNVSTSNILLEKLDDEISITVTLSTIFIDIGIENNVSTPTTPCDNQFLLETELTALKSFALEPFFLINRSIQEIKYPNNEAANSCQQLMLLCSWNR